MRLRRALIFAPLLALALIGPATAWAQTSKPKEPEGLVVDCTRQIPQKDATGNVVTDSDGNTVYITAHYCTLDDFLLQFVVLIRFGLKIVTALAVLMLVFGGFQYITAGGRHEKVESGQRIVAGTVIGIIISLTAYVTVNFAVAAITGTQVKSINPFQGFIATVFQGKRVGQQNINRPFSGGQTTVETRTKCRAKWNVACSDQVYCADPGSAEGKIMRLQKDLDTLKCDCQGEDGCYGDKTARCVQRFQVAQHLPPSGELTDDTAGKLRDWITQYNSAGTPAAKQTVIDQAGCESADTKTIMAQIPKSALQTYSQDLAAERDDTGCCVVGTSDGTSYSPLFCLPDVSRLTCRTISPQYAFSDTISFGSGKSCADPSFREFCGFCSTCNGACAATAPASRGAQSCFQYAAKEWCENVAQPPLTYYERTCNGNSLCGYPDANCKDALLLRP